MDGMDKAHSKQHQISFQFKLSSGDGLHFLVYTDAVEFFYIAVRAGEFLRHDRKFPLRAFLMTC